MNCVFCGKECKNKNSHVNHERMCKNNPDRKMIPKNEKWRESMRNRKTTNQYIKANELGLDKPKYSVTDETRKKISESNRKRFSDIDNRKKHSESMKLAVKNNPDSYSKNNVCGRVKIIEYKGEKLKGSWELKTAKWLDKLEYDWVSEVNPQSYFWNESWHLYFPDFFLPNENVYIEVKGYKRERDVAKWSHFKGTLLLVDIKTINDLDKLSIKDLERLA